MSTEPIEDKKNRNWGLITSVVLHGLVLILFLFLGLTAKKDLPKQRGMIVNFGTAQTGHGKQAQTTPTPPKSTQQKSTTAPQQQKATEKKQEVLTQEEPTTPSIQQEEEEDIQKEDQPTKQEKTSIESEQQTKEQKEEKKQQEREKPKVNPDALYQGNKNKADEQTGEGVTVGEKDQGKKEGKQSGSHKGKADAKGKTGIGFSLEGRSMVSTPTVRDRSQKTGQVKIQIRVNQQGKVVRAKYQLKGSTTQDPHLVKKARKAARKARFNTDENAPEVQVGTITFNFKLK